MSVVKFSELVGDSRGHFSSIVRKARHCAGVLHPRETIGMGDTQKLDIPVALNAILAETEALDFAMASEPRTDCCCERLPDRKPRLIELGTGTGGGYSVAPRRHGHAITSDFGRAAPSGRVCGE